MTDQSNVFEPTTPSATPDTNANPDLTALANQLKGITNEDGNQKYDTLPKALEGLANSQTRIPELKTQLNTVQAENTALKEQLAKAEAVEDVVSRLTQNQQAAPAEATPQASGLDENAVMQLLERVNTQNAVAASEDTNEQTVNTALINSYGDKAGDVMTAKAAELGTTVQALQKLSRENPQVVLAAFGQQSAPTTSPTTSSVNIPRMGVPEPERVTAPEKSLLSGSTTREKMAFMDQIKAEVYKDFDITG